MSHSMAQKPARANLEFSWETSKPEPKRPNPSSTVSVPAENPHPQIPHPYAIKTQTHQKMSVDHDDDLRPVGA